MISKTFSFILAGLLVAPILTIEAAVGPNTEQKQSAAIAPLTQCAKGVSVLLNPVAPIKLRITAAHSLPLDLTNQDADTLFRFLAAHDDTREKNTDGLRFLKNEVMTALRVQDQFVTDTANVLIQISNDEHQDMVIRDYAVQHLCTIYETQESSTLRTQVLIAVRKHVLRADVLAASALLAFHHINESDSSVSADLLCRRAVQLASSPNCCIRVPAIAICAQRKLKEALPLIRKLAAAEDDPSRVAAVAALGFLGDREDISMLRQLQMHKDSCLNNAMAEAVTRLNRRFEKKGLAQTQP